VAVAFFLGPIVVRELARLFSDCGSARERGSLAYERLRPTGSLRPGSPQATSVASPPWTQTSRRSIGVDRRSAASYATRSPPPGFHSHSSRARDGAGAG
jgi:hypothetical protein